MRNKIHLEQLCDNVEGDKFKKFTPLKKIRYICVHLLNEFKNLTHNYKKIKNSKELQLMFVYHTMWEFYTRYYSGDSKIYLIAERFGAHLAQTNLMLPLETVPYHPGNYYCFEMQKLFEGGAGVYYKTMFLGFPEVESGKVVRFVVPEYDHRGELTAKAVCWYNKLPNKTNLGKKSNSSISVAEWVEQGRKDQGKDLLDDFVKYVIKCLIYVESGKPDLSPEQRITNAKNPGKLRRFYRDNCPFEIVKVGYRFNKGMVYYKDETNVIGHFRWQPYGEARSKVKLIWIDEHIRKFKNVLTNSKAKEKAYSAPVSF